MPINVKASRAIKEARATKHDAVMRQLASARPAQIDAWIDKNVTDLASAKDVLKALAKAVVMRERQSSKGQEREYKSRDNHF